MLRIPKVSARHREPASGSCGWSRMESPIRATQTGRFAAEKTLQPSRGSSRSVRALRGAEQGAGPGRAAGMGWGGGRAGGLIKLFRWSVGCERCCLWVQDKFGLFSAGCCRALNQLCEKWSVFCSRQQRGTPGQCLSSLKLLKSQCFKNRFPFYDMT